MAISTGDLLNAHPDYLGARWSPWVVVDSYHSYREEGTKFAIRHKNRMGDKPTITPCFYSYEELDKYMCALQTLEQ